jgi:hypothetical protein
MGLIIQEWKRLYWIFHARLYQIPSILQFIGLFAFLDLWNLRRVAYVFAAGISIWQPRRAVGLAEAPQADRPALALLM